MTHRHRHRTLPFATLIIPVTGAPPGLTSNLKSLINQQYKSFDILFVLKDQNDPAVSVISKLTKRHEHAAHIYSGKTTNCSQKNHNLLAGVRKAGNKPDVLVFCDSGHTAHPNWLEALLQPLLLQNSCSVTSGYHQIYPKNQCVSSQGRAICVLTLSLIRKLPFLGQPWGGATAIQREVFESVAVTDTWKENIVDDVSLAKILQKQHINVTIPPGTDLQTQLQDFSFQSWAVWLTRQWAYLRFVFPGLWFAAGLFSFVNAVSVLSASGICISSLFFPFSHLLLQYSLICVLLFVIFTTFLYFKHPAPGSFFLWFPASFAALAMAAYCHSRTWFSTVLHWANIQYKVGRNGKVLEITREQNP